MNTTNDTHLPKSLQHHAGLPAQILGLPADKEEPPTCILTGAPGEDPEDCTTHAHEERPSKPKLTSMHLPKSIQTHAGLIAQVLGTFHALAYDCATGASHTKRLGELLLLVDQVSDSGPQRQGVMQAASDMKEIYNRGQGDPGPAFTGEFVCGYCGTEFSGLDGVGGILDHHKTCLLNPARQLEEDNKTLRTALGVVVGEMDDLLRHSHALPVRYQAPFRMIMDRCNNLLHPAPATDWA